MMTCCMTKMAICCVWRKGLCKGWILTGVIWAICISPLYGQGGPREESPGFHGTLSLGVAEVRQERLSQARIDSYEDDPEVNRQVAPLPVVQLRYVDMDKRSHWFFGTGNTGLQAGRKQDTAVGILTIAVGTSLSVGEGREFRNPYLLGESRSRTNTTVRSFVLGYGVGEEWGLDLEYQQQTVDYWQDSTPDLDPALGRDATNTFTSIGLRLLVLNLKYQQQIVRAEGDADSSQGGEAQAQLVIPIIPKRLLIMGNIGQGQAEFDAVHPIFNEIREDNTHSTLVRVMLLFEPYQFFVMSIQRRTDSNIDFFDSQTQMGAIGGGWRF